MRAAGDLELGMGRHAEGVRVGPGVRMQRLPALFRPSLERQVIVMSESEARRRFLNLVVASLGANRKTRTLCKPTYSDQTKKGPKKRLMYKRALREKSRLGELTSALSADVSEAHRQVPAHPQDWHYLGCQVDRGSDVFIHIVGTFGVSSASYHCSRVAGSNGRLAQRWLQMIFCWSVEDHGTEWGLILFFVLCLTCVVPLS